MRQHSFAGHPSSHGLPQDDKKPVRGANVTDLRQSNAALVFRLLQQHSPCSRADLARLSGLTAPTVSAVVDDLRRRNLVKLGGQGVSTGGRPPTIVEINTAHWYVIGVDIGALFVRLALADLNGAIVLRDTTRLESGHTPETVTDLVAETVARLCKSAGITTKNILLITAGAPGITDLEKGLIVSAPNLHNWDNIPLRDLIESKTGIACVVENDVNLGALGEAWMGAAKGASDFIFISIGTGVGAGIVLNGRLHRGSANSAGEVGYMLVPGLPQSPLKLSQLGRLEGAIGGRSIEEAWSDANRGQHLLATEVFELAAQGDRKAGALLEQSASYLAAALTNIGLVLDITLVVLGGGVGSSPILVAATDELMQQNEIGRPTLLVSGLGIDAEIFGAIRLGLQVAESQDYRRRPVMRRRRA